MPPSMGLPRRIAISVKLTFCRFCRSVLSSLIFPPSACASALAKPYRPNFGITGSFHSVSKAHLHRYCDEFSFRWNERKVSDEVRTVKALGLIEGARLMYKEPVRRRA